MNVRNDVIINSPNNKNETCTEFVIDDITKPFMLNGTTEVGEDYTFSAWIKSSEESSINIYGESIPITNEWKRKRVTFNATGRGIRIYFDKVGTYYFYKSQLELGKVMSDASPSPEDIKASLEVKINKENLISEINASADIIRLTGDRLIIDSTNLQVAEDGTITAKNGNFSGTIKGSDGEFTEGFSVKLAVDDSEFFELKMKTDNSIKSFFAGIDSSDDMGKSYLKIRPSYLDILSLYLNISGGRTLELCSGGEITLDAPSVEMLSTLYSSCYVSIPNGTLELNGIKVFMDSRSGMYCEEFTEGSTIMTDYLNVESGTEHYEKTFKNYGITHALIYNETIINQYISEDLNYECIYQDDIFALYERVK